ncbi:MAG: epoxyqueuosine reductase QueH [Bacilli bacterium]
MKINYQLQLDEIISELTSNNEVPTLLLHSCCAPCSSYVLLYLSQYFKITVFFYNPNVMPDTEYERRLREQIRLIKTVTTKYLINFIEGSYEPKVFLEQSKGLEKEKEGSRRCFKCYQMRLEQTAKLANAESFDYFATTLTVSPYKNSDKINEIGKFLEDKYNIKYLVSDFKKRNGYKESIRLSKEYDLYRQHYCGCPFSHSINEELTK